MVLAIFSTCILAGFLARSRVTLDKWDLPIVPLRGNTGDCPWVTRFLSIFDTHTLCLNGSDIIIKTERDDSVLVGRVLRHNNIRREGFIVLHAALDSNHNKEQGNREDNLGNLSESKSIGV